MVEQRRYWKPREDAGRATAEEGVVILDGPDGVAVTMTVEAAEKTAESLQQAARQARAAGAMRHGANNGNSDAAGA